MKMVVILMVVCVCTVAWIGGYYYHLNHVKRTTPRDVFKCETHIKLDANNKPIETRVYNCKRNPKSVTF